jgi:large subunit ribosomal protein L24
VKIRRGDTVEVMSGRDKGHRGEVIKIFPSKGRIVVQNANIRKKHQRQVQSGGRTMNPGIIQFEAPMHISNVRLVCPKCDEPARVGIQGRGDERQRVCKQCQAVIDA